MKDNVVGAVVATVAFLIGLYLSVKDVVSKPVAMLIGVTIIVVLSALAAVLDVVLNRIFKSKK